MYGEAFNNTNFSYNKVTNRRVFMKDVHFHDDYELYYLVDGTTKYLIEDEVFCVKKGNFVFVPKGLWHKTDSEECLHNERILVCFGDEVFEDDSMKPILKELSDAKLICVEKSSLHKVTDVLQKLQNEYNKERAYMDVMVGAYIKELLVLLLRYKSVEEQVLSEADKFIYDISDYILNNFAEDIKLSTLSKRFAISDGQLSRKFKAVMGMGLNEYIRYIRILNSERLLTSTKLSVTEIAKKCGFYDSNYFSTVFKALMGTTPIKYRNINRSEQKM